ncbi:MAG: hypothetical protein MUP11_00710 [Anaerolineales bacterium]|nr:hypothetical protein [Anaerolineales bacterium]
MLSLLLLLIFFWGINIAFTVLPIFLNIGTIKNLLIAGISSQVITRALVGIWALEELSLKKDVTTNKKIGSFLLSFIPIGGIFTFLNAARTIIRREKISNLSIASIASALIMTIMLYASKDGIAEISGGGVDKITSTPNPGVIIITPDDTDIPATATQRTYATGCRNPNSVTIDEVEDNVEVCGKVTNFGVIECQSCLLGFYSFLKLDGKFQVISYDQHFSFTWLGKCLRISDDVEILGEVPIFQFRKGDSECSKDTHGELVCKDDNYFKDYFDCN